MCRRTPGTFWSGRIVEESTVHRLISQARGVLGDSAKASNYIKTVSKRGYQAVAPVALDEPAEAAPEPADAPEPPSAPAQAPAEPDDPQPAKPEKGRRLRVGSAALLAIAVIALTFAVAQRQWKAFVIERALLRTESIAVLPLEDLTRREE